MGSADRPHESAVRAMANALARETHVLWRRPDLVWQQLHNRLQWLEDPLESLITAERENPGEISPHAQVLILLGI